MDRRRQPVMRMGAGAARRQYDEPDDEWGEPTALTRGWAATRLVVLVIGCGLGAGITLGIALWIALTALESSV
jgi:hypothetical protein